MSRYVDIEKLDFIAMKDKSDDFAAGVQWVLKQLNECPVVEVSEDCISRKAINDNDIDVFKVDGAYMLKLKDLQTLIDGLPSVVPDSIHGEWIQCDEIISDDGVVIPMRWMCSKCGRDNDNPDDQYCRDCGSRNVRKMK